MPVTGCTWRSSRNAPGCWDRGEPPRPARACRTRASRGVPVPSPAWSLLARVWGPEVVVRRRCRRSWRSSGPGCQGRPALGCRGWGHPARAGTFLCGRGRPARPGTGMLSPTASNAPARKDTHPATWNVPVVGDGQLDAGAQSRRTHLKARGLYPQGAMLVASGAFSTTCGLGCPRVRSRRTAGYFRDGNLGQLSAQTECQRTGEVHPGEQDRPYIRG